LAGSEVPNEVAFTLLWRAGAGAETGVPIFISIAILGVWVANAAAIFSAPEGIDDGGTFVWRPAVALVSGFEAVALAAFVVEHVVLRAYLGRATASASVWVVGFGEIACVPVLVGSTFLG
jgi:hypothetical protein